MVRSWYVTPRAATARRAAPAAWFAHSTRALELERRIDQPVAEPRHAIGPLEADRRKAGGAIVEHALEVPVADPSAAGKPYPAHAEHRARVPRAARLEVAAQPLQVSGGLGETDLQIDALLGTEIVGPQHLARDGGEPLAELLQPVAPDGEPRGHVMTAVSLEQIATREQSRVQVESRDAAARALADVAVERDEERGASVSLHHSRRDDADNAGMPAVAHQNEPGIVVEIGLLLQLRQRLVEHALIEGLSFDVEPVEPSGQLMGLGLIVGEQKPESVGGVADPSRRVEPWPEDEAAVAGTKLSRGQAPGPDQRADTGPARVGQQAKPVLDENPVLADQRHDVGHGRERHEVEQVVRQVGRETERGDERLHQLEGHPAATQGLSVRRVVRSLGIDHCERRRQLIAGKVVVGDHHADRQRPWPRAPSPAR